ncbi:unnamed protein product [Chrysodeixis includens]|uniref:Uncharacterized protein n=1 Tax=Chrysodeixis includens TaxID=689277 RepID=A0A9N8KTA7_CHRIL|nr:unnamed protein product [Chrysodeixis includens]
MCPSGGAAGPRYIANVTSHKSNDDTCSLTTRGVEINIAPVTSVIPHNLHIPGARRSRRDCDDSRSHPIAPAHLSPDPAVAPAVSPTHVSGLRGPFTGAPYTAHYHGVGYTRTMGRRREPQHPPRPRDSASHMNLLLHRTPTQLHE